MPPRNASNNNVRNMLVAVLGVNDVTSEGVSGTDHGVQERKSTY